MSFTLRFDDNIDNWNAALEQIMAVPAYRNLISETTEHAPIVIHNQPFNSQHSDDTSTSAFVFGWTVSTEQIFSDFPAATCTLTHCRVRLLADGSVINPLAKGDYGHCIFVRDDDRTYTDYCRKRYNQRVCFADHIVEYSPHYGCRVESNQLYYAHGSRIERDSDFEVYHEFCDDEIFLDAVHFYAPSKKLEEWVAMCTNVTFDYRKRRR